MGASYAWWLKSTTTSFFRPSFTLFIVIILSLLAGFNNTAPLLDDSQPRGMNKIYRQSFFCSFFFLINIIHHKNIYIYIYIERRKRQRRGKKKKRREKKREEAREEKGSSSKKRDQEKQNAGKKRRIATIHHNKRKHHHTPRSKLRRIGFSSLFFNSVFPKFYLLFFFALGRSSFILLFPQFLFYPCATYYLDYTIYSFVFFPFKWPNTTWKSLPLLAFY